MSRRVTVEPRYTPGGAELQQKACMLVAVMMCMLLMYGELVTYRMMND